MSIKKLDFKFVNELRRNEQVKELANKVNEVIDGTNPILDHLTFDSTNIRFETENDIYTSGDIELNDLKVNGKIILGTGSDQSVKKIYFHPVAATGSATIAYGVNGETTYSGKIEVSGIILNNSNVQLNTFAALTQAIKNFSQSNYTSLVATGIVYFNNKSVILRSLTYNKTTDAIYAEGLDTAGVEHYAGNDAYSIRIDNWQNTYDYVNPIN